MEEKINTGMEKFPLKYSSDIHRASFLNRIFEKASSYISLDKFVIIQSN